MIVMRTYKFKVYRSKKNKYLDRQIEIAGCIWNHGIALHRRYYRMTGQSLSQFALMKHITKLKKLPKYAFWNSVGSQAIQDVVQRMDRAYKLFYRNLQAGIKSAPPKFKKVKKYTSFTLKQAGYKLLAGNKIRIQGTVYKFSKSRDIPADIKTLTVKRDTLGSFYLYFVVQEEIVNPSQAMSGHSAGFDFGLKTFLTASDGSRIASPLYYRQALDDLRKAQRKVSSKVKFSNNWRKAKSAVARLHRTVVNRRRDWFFKLAHELTDSYDYLFFEDLAIKGMQTLWGRKIGDLARSEFMNVLGYIATSKGKVVHLIDRFFPSSKSCADCGHIRQNLTLSERRWVCDRCGITHDRDHNASINILREGTQGVPASLGLSDARLSLRAITV